MVSSPGLVIYAELLLLVQYVYGLQLTDDELPLQDPTGTFDYSELGLKKWKFPCLHLGAQARFSLSVTSFEASDVIFFKISIINGFQFALCFLCVHPITDNIKIWCGKKWLGILKLNLHVEKLKRHLSFTITMLYCIIIQEWSVLFIFASLLVKINIRQQLGNTIY